ncbi:UDP-2,3-diacylglucosamine diphosphatase [Mucilaginibacter myungsuensis]|uniref:UDP-2,3-diacylglucosamine diphosphatase n=1 Tax=Mucilaginibacter myungsuensis TaxID=649104 RepID=A0A929KZF0_9SPHI|nr:UDP-2,3-diacylglucosamine diphosphatase [Mucilaginibacter myungsuensis]MBE9663283.1 UDP-2,3-diacylglucosamine diphosphatase [Mucilaginibacter myungsuensis]MDN3600018.1 UDP-2,3-diacylglucosamine diphosphatase [Mucilaginibacter myungsuensis]
MPDRHKIYFASDFHLGTPSFIGSRERELRVVQWLDTIKADAAEVFLVGDVFDFWFEYKTVVPKGYTRFLGKLAELADMGIKLYFFKGNHDMWMFDYLVQELGATIISDEMVIERGGKKIYIHHGDGLGPGDTKYKFLKKIFRSKLCQWLFARLHPNLGIGIATGWSQHSRAANMKEEIAKPGEQEWLVKFCNDTIQAEYYDYLIFGHRHIPLDIVLKNQRSRYVNLGEWFNYSYSYAVFDGVELTLHFDKKPR